MHSSNSVNQVSLLHLLWLLVWLAVSIELVLQILVGVLNLSSATGTPGPGASSEIKAHPTSQLTRRRDGELCSPDNSLPDPAFFFAIQHCIPSTHTHAYRHTLPPATPHTLVS